MAVTHYLANFDRLYENSAETKITINKLVEMDMANFSDEAVINSIMTAYDSDAFSTVPKCSCEEQPMKGAFLEGVYCPRCGTEVKKQYEGIGNDLWLKSVYVDNHEIKFMSPIIFRNISLILTYQKKKDFEPFNYIEWMMDTSINIPETYKVGKHAELAYAILEDVLGGVRGYRYVTEKYVDILQYVISSTRSDTKQKEKAKAALDLYMNDDYARIPGTHDGIMSSHFPIISNKLFVMENNAKGKFANLKSTMSLGIVKNWVNLCREIKNQDKIESKRPLTIERVGNVVTRIVRTASEQFQEIYREEISQKQGLSRKQIFGYRCGFSFRGLIVCKIAGNVVEDDGEGTYGRLSNFKTIEDLRRAHELHPLDTISIPWKIAISTFNIHLTRMLLEDGYSVKDTRRILDEALTKYSPVVHQLLDRIKADFNGKIPIIAIRNPTLLRGSLMLMHVDHIETNVEDPTIGINPLVIKVFNGDFDGDQMSFMLLLDKYMVELMEGFRLKYALYSVKSPCAIEGFMTNLTTGNQVIGEYLRDAIEDPSEDKLYDLIMAMKKGKR